MRVLAKYAIAHAIAYSHITSIPNVCETRTCKISADV